MQGVIILITQSLINKTLFVQSKIHQYFHKKKKHLLINVQYNRALTFR